jgi:hypothetical protein
MAPRTEKTLGRSLALVLVEHADDQAVTEPQQSLDELLPLVNRNVLEPGPDVLETLRRLPGERVAGEDAVRPPR